MKERKKKKKFRLDTPHKSFPSLILTVPFNQIYSQTNKKVISNFKLKGLGLDKIPTKQNWLEDVFWKTTFSFTIF